MAKGRKKLNKLGFLGFLGLIGLMGYSTGHTGLYGFFGFFAYFHYFNVIPDELFKENLRKATTPSFFISLIMMSISLFITVFTSNISIIASGMALSYAVSLITFSSILAYLEIKENIGTK